MILLNWPIFQDFLLPRVCEELKKKNQIFFPNYIQSNGLMENSNVKILTAREKGRAGLGKEGKGSVGMGKDGKGRRRVEERKKSMKE